MRGCTNSHWGSCIAGHFLTVTFKRARSEVKMTIGPDVASLWTSHRGIIQAWLAEAPSYCSISSYTSSIVYSCWRSHHPWAFVSTYVRPVRDVWRVSPVIKEDLKGLIGWGENFLGIIGHEVSSTSSSSVIAFWTTQLRTRSLIETWVIFVIWSIRPLSISL